MKLASQYKHILIWIPFTVFIFALGTYSLSNFYGDYHKYWQSQVQSDQQERTIASSIDSLEYDAYKDYFYNNSFNKYLNYKISTDIWTNLTNSATKNSVKKAFKQTVVQTLDKNQSLQDPLVHLFQQDILASVIENFISNLNKNKIGKGKFQIDINFTPQFEQNLNYISEQSVGNLINLNDYSLREKLEKQEISLSRSIITTQMPPTYKRYQYGGGTISISLDLEKLKQEQKLVQLKFRRYFRADKLTVPDIDINSSELKIKMFQLESTDISKHNFITIDLCKIFSLESGESNKEKVIFHFGKVVPSINNGGHWLESLQSSAKEQTIITGDFFVHGKYFTPERKIKTKIKLDKLVYSFQTKSFTNDSKIIVQLHTREPASFDKIKESANIKNIFRNYSAEKVIKELELEKFIYRNSEMSGEIL